MEGGWAEGTERKTKRVAGVLGIFRSLSLLGILSILSILQKKEPLAGLQQTSKGARSGDSDLFGEVDILNGVEELGALLDGTLEGFATRDETLSAGALVDDGGLGSLGEVVGAGGAARVD